jgi:hypothetical protein
MKALLLTPDGDRYKVAEDFEYKNVVVPKGHKTDGISYKLRLVALVIDRYSPKYITAAVVHDYLTDEGNWELANKYFEELLPNDKLSKIMISSVKIYHKIMYGV